MLTQEESQERTYRTNARRQQADEEDPERRQAQQEAEREARAKREAEDRERVERSQRQQEERKRKEEEKRRQEEKQQEEDLHRRKMQAAEQGPHNDEVSGQPFSSFIQYLECFLQMPGAGCSIAKFANHLCVLGSVFCLCVLKPYTILEMSSQITSGYPRT